MSITLSFFLSLLSLPDLGIRDEPVATIRRRHGLDLNQNTPKMGGLAGSVNGKRGKTRGPARRFGRGTGDFAGT
ncbi:MAG: hypothetical protein OEO83_15895, partial [Alphaproteobacteria bacterium]|nr:hypothetical protein [Alphaproteobacteria bacterium]